jgi:hypothetical protein
LSSSDLVLLQEKCWGFIYQVVHWSHPPLMVFGFTFIVPGSSRKCHSRAFQRWNQLMVWLISTSIGLTRLVNDIRLCNPFLLLLSSLNFFNWLHKKYYHVLPCTCCINGVSFSYVVSTLLSSMSDFVNLPYKRYVQYASKHMEPASNVKNVILRTM